MADQPTRVTVRSAVTTAGVTSAALLLAAAAAIPAFADPPSDGDHGQSNATHGNNGNHYGQAKDHASGQGGADESGHNPPGNNGTVKIHDDYGDTALHNVPHVDCDFAVAFWGFDTDQTLNVSFAGQAPTGKDTPLTVTGAATSITSPDEAGGGQDYDGELDFSADQLDLASLGDPHPQQGYHVKLSVDTGEPGGHKYKVFWLQPCAPAGAPSASGTTTQTPETQTPETQTPQTQSGSDTPDTGVLGETVTKPPATSAGNSAGSASTSQNAAVPTEVLGQHFSRNNSAAAPTAASLPFTGAEIGGLAAAAALALGAGAALTVAGRRRRRESVSES
jgi:hypothetical protein